MDCLPQMICLEIEMAGGLLDSSPSWLAVCDRLAPSVNPICSGRSWQWSHWNDDEGRETAIYRSLIPIRQLHSVHCFKESALHEGSSSIGEIDFSIRIQTLTRGFRWFLQQYNAEISQHTRIYSRIYVCKTSLSRIWIPGPTMRISSVPTRRYCKQISAYGDIRRYVSKASVLRIYILSSTMRISPIVSRYFEEISVYEDSRR